jgi:probable phosphoglycerate mutase
MELFLIRHGETAWSTQARYTSRTDLPLTDRGREEAIRAREVLLGLAGPLSKLDSVSTSPMKRARQTSALIFEPPVEPVVSDLLTELDFGDFEGCTGAEAQERRPGWDLWRDGGPEGESLDHLAHRAQRFLDTLPPRGRSVVVAHGYIVRAIAACAVGWPPTAGRALVCDTGSVSVVNDRAGRVAIDRWNVVR